MRIGMPWEDGVRITPLAEPDKTERLEELKEDAVNFGAKWVNAPARGTPCRVGNLYQPAVLADVPDADCPVRTVRPNRCRCRRSALQEPITYVQESPYSQQASVFGQASEAAWIVDALSPLVSCVHVNRQCRRRPDTLPSVAARTVPPAFSPFQTVCGLFPFPARSLSSRIWTRRRPAPSDLCSAAAIAFLGRKALRKGPPVCRGKIMPEAVAKDGGPRESARKKCVPLFQSWLTAKKDPSWTKRN